MKTMMKRFKKYLLRHPFMAAFAVFLCALALREKGFSYGGLLLAVFFLTLLAVSVWDAETMCIPDSCHIAILTLGVLKLLFSRSSLSSSVAGLLCVSVPLLLISLWFGGFGGGDIKLCGACGFFLGPAMTVMGALLGSILGAAFACRLILTKKAGRKSSIPFGPFLSLGFALCSLYGQSWLSGYLSLFL